MFTPSKCSERPTAVCRGEFLNGWLTPAFAHSTPAVTGAFSFAALTANAPAFTALLAKITIKVSGPRLFVGDTNKPGQTRTFDKNGDSCRNSRLHSHYVVDYL